MTIFTAKDSALLLIDHQVGTMQLVKNIPYECNHQCLSDLSSFECDHLSCELYGHRIVQAVKRWNH
jgi:hypothetical protein